MKPILPIAALLFFASCSTNVIKSPDGTLEVKISDDATLALYSEGVCLMDGIKLGMQTNASIWKDNLTISSAGASRKIVDDYTMLSGKRLHCTNQATEREYKILNPEGEPLFIQLRAYDDGLAFRYRLEGEGQYVTADHSSYNIPDGTRRWIQNYEPTGYENFYPMALDGSRISPRQRNSDWGYPALVQSDEEHFILISEADLRADMCGSYLSNENDSQTYEVVLADDALKPFSGSWYSSWHVLIAGSLSEVVESTLITDVSTPSKLKDTDWIKPGPVSWIYWAHNHGSQDYRIVTEYIDFAAEMGWKYNLIDAEWDNMGNGGDIEDALAYAREKGVSPMIWYNSSTNWVGEGSGAPTPYYRLNAPDDRRREFEWLNSQEVSGIKVDFFRGDKYEDINYYIDLMESSAEHKIMINFHGSTLPRGWQRTYPHLMTMESVYGAEWYNNLPVLTGMAASHNATLPFTRNVVGSMDYTPGTFSDSQHPHITTHAHELALTVLFESSLQHMPDSPSSYQSLPGEVIDLLSTLPTVWDDTKLLAGYPGEYAVIARKSGNTWYVAGINGSDQNRNISFSLSRLGGENYNALAFLDESEDRVFKIETLKLNDEVSIDCFPRGGFLLKISE